jgi:hypothetical protein
METKPKIKSYHSWPILFDPPSLLTIVQDEIEMVIQSESNEHIRVNKTKTSLCCLNNKSFVQFGLMTINLIFQTILLYQEYNGDKIEQENSW